jgi:hypothetical protein
VTEITSADAPGEPHVVLMVSLGATTMRIEDRRTLRQARSAVAKGLEAAAHRARPLARARDCRFSIFPEGIKAGALGRLPDAIFAV